MGGDLHGVADSLETFRIPLKRANAHQCVAVDPCEAIVREWLSVVDSDKRSCGERTVCELLQRHQHAVGVVLLTAAVGKTANQVIEHIRRDSRADDQMTKTEQIERLLHDRCR